MPRSQHLITRMEDQRVNQMRVVLDEIIDTECKKPVVNIFKDCECICVDSMNENTFCCHNSV